MQHCIINARFSLEYSRLWDGTYTASIFNTHQLIQSKELRFRIRPVTTRKCEKAQTLHNTCYVSESVDFHVKGWFWGNIKDYLNME